MAERTDEIDSGWRAMSLEGPRRVSHNDSHRVTVISPHFDDVPLSLGQSLRNGSLSKHDVRVRVAFGRTNWTIWVHPTAGRAPYVSTWRRLEESVASLAFGYRWTAANWPEVILRTEDRSPEQILDATRDLAAEPLIGEVARWISAICRAPQEDRKSVV